MFIDHNTYTDGDSLYAEAGPLSGGWPFDGLMKFIFFCSSFSREVPGSGRGGGGYLLTDDSVVLIWFVVLLSSDACHCVL